MNIRFEVVLGAFWTSHHILLWISKGRQSLLSPQNLLVASMSSGWDTVSPILSRLGWWQALPCAGPVNGGRRNRWEIDCIAVSCLEHGISQPLSLSSSSYIRLPSLWAHFLNLRQDSIVEVLSVGTSIQFSRFLSTLGSHESLHSLLFIARGSFFGYD